MIIDEFLMSVVSRQIGGRLIKASVIGRNAIVDAEVCKPRIEPRNRAGSDELGGSLNDEIVDGRRRIGGLVLRSVNSASGCSNSANVGNLFAAIR
jgi:hypothetical protein